MASIDPQVGQFVRPGPGWSQRPWCRVTATGEDTSRPYLGKWFIAEYPVTCTDPKHAHQPEPYLQWAGDHNYRFCEVADAIPDEVTDNPKFEVADTDLVITDKEGNRL